MYVEGRLIVYLDFQLHRWSRPLITTLLKESTSLESLHPSLLGFPIHPTPSEELPDGEIWRKAFAHVSLKPFLGGSLAPCSCSI